MASKLMKKIRKMGTKGYIQPTPKRTKAIKLKERKISQGIEECFFSSTDSSPYIDNEVLNGL